MNADQEVSNGHIDSTFAWCLVRTRPRLEYLAANIMERNGYDLYFPRVQAPITRIRGNDIPMFPGYLFIRLNGDVQYPPSVSHLDGVLGWVQFGGVVPFVSDVVISELRQRITKINKQGGYWRRYHQGEKVVVQYGPMAVMAEVLGEVESYDANVRVLLDFMGQWVTAKVPWKSLEPAMSGFDSSHRVNNRARRTRGRGRWIRGFGPRRKSNMSIALNDSGDTY